MASWKYDPGISLEGPRETMKNLNQDNRCLGWDFKLGPQKQGARIVQSVQQLVTGWTTKGLEFESQ